MNDKELREKLAKELYKDSTFLFSWEELEPKGHKEAIKDNYYDLADQILSPEFLKLLAPKVVELGFVGIDEAKAINAIMSRKIELITVIDCGECASIASALASNPGIIKAVSE